MNTKGVVCRVNLNGLKDMQFLINIKHLWKAGRKINLERRARTGRQSVGRRLPTYKVELRRFKKSAAGATSYVGSFSNGLLMAEMMILMMLSQILQTTF